MEREVFLGITNDNELAFANIEVRHPVYYNQEKGRYTDEDKLQFSASFYTDSVFNKTKYIESGEFEESIQDFVEYDMDADTKLHLLEQWDCPMSELAEKLSEEESVENWIDNSCFPLSIEVDNDEYIFRAEAGGQHDLREEGMKIYQDENLFNKINEYWDKYHLKAISEEESKQLFDEIDKSLAEGKLIEKSDSLKMEEYLKEFIHELNKEEDYEL